MNKPLRVPQLVQAFRLVSDIYTPAFIHAGVNVVVGELEGFCGGPAFAGYGNRNVVFEIGDICHGIGTAIYAEGEFKALQIKQLTCKNGLIYTEFYRFRHGNEELMSLLRPLIEAKMRHLLVPLV